MARSLNSQMLRVMSALTLVAFGVMYFGWFAYYTIIYDWLSPNTPITDRWTTSDFVILGVMLTISLVSAAAVAWHQAQSIVRPLKSVATAARSIADGNFSSRAGNTGKAFGEAETLLADFNTMAERLESAETELKYSNSAIAHELRTPLTILKGRLQGLLDGAYEPGPDLYRRLISHVDDLARIVEDLRTLGLSSAGQLQLKLEKFDLAEEAAVVTAAVEHDLVAAGIMIERDFGHASVVADRARIRQVLFAILDNVRRYAPDSTVLVQTRRTTDLVLIRCSDTGPGLPVGSEKRAFERFWRGAESRSRASGGSGLGLSVVQAIARAHGGDATIADNGGKGTSIEIWLPATTRP